MNDFPAPPAGWHDTGVFGERGERDDEARRVEHERKNVEADGSLVPVEQRKGGPEQEAA